MPIYVAALSLAAVERAAEVADGLMPTMWSPERVEKSAEYITRGRKRSHEASGTFELTLGLPTFIGDDLHQAAGYRAGESRPLHGVPVLPSDVARKRLHRRGQMPWIEAQAPAH